MAMHFRYNIYGNGTNIMMCKICHKVGDYTRDCQSREKRSKLSRKDEMKKFSNRLKSNKKKKNHGNIIYIYIYIL